MDFPGSSDGKASAYNVEDLGSIPGSGRSAGEGNGNLFQPSFLEIPWIEEHEGLQSMGLPESDTTRLRGSTSTTTATMQVLFL